VVLHGFSVCEQLSVLRQNQKLVSPFTCNDQGTKMLPFPHLFTLCVTCLASGQAPSSTTIVDLLSSSGDFNSFLRILQQSRLIPYLNQPGANLTLFAVSDKAVSIQDISVTLPRHHILTESVTSKSSNSHIFTSLAGFGLRVQNDGKDFMVDGRRVRRKDWLADNGVVHVIDLPLATPPSNLQIFETLPELESLHHVSALVSNSTNSTFLAPTNEAFRDFTYIEWNYLTTPVGESDLRLLLDRHSINRTIYHQDVKNLLNVTSREGSSTVLETHGNVLLADGNCVVAKDIITTNGVVHVINRLLVTPRLVFSPLTYLFGMGLNAFADENIEAGFTALLNDSSVEQSIFAPQNLRKPMNLLYHFAPTTNLASFHGLLETKDVSAKLNGRAQQLYFNGTSIGGVRILRNSTIGNTTIYEIEKQLSSPNGFVSESESIAKEFLVGNTLSKMHGTGLSKEVLASSGITTFVPQDTAWTSLGLVESFLTRNPNLLHYVLSQMTFRSLLYSKYTSGISRSLANESTAINMTDRNVFFNNTLVFKINKTDQLTENGVFHVVDNVPLPQGLQISARDLMNAANCTFFPLLLEAKNLSHVFDSDNNYTFLVPTDRALRYANVSRKDIFLDDLLRLHVLLPSSSDSDVSEKSTFMDGITVGFRHVEDFTLVRLVGGVGREVRVLNQGKTSTGSQVFILDRELRPEWVGRGSSTGHWLWVWILIGIVGFLWLLAIAYGFRIFRRKRAMATNGENAPLLVDENDHREQASA